MSKKNLFIIGAVIIGLGIGTIIGLQQIKSSEITTAQEESNQEEAVSQRLTPEQALAEYNQTRTAEQRAEAIEKIKAIFGEDLEITFKEAEANYHLYGNPRPVIITDFVQVKVIETYEDNKGFETEIDAETNTILSRRKSCIEETQRITSDQAKEIAKNLLAKLVDNPEDYELAIENRNPQVYNSIWRKWHEGEFYSVIPSGKGQNLARMENRIIAICLRNGELMHYEYEPALTEAELTEMAKRWEETQKKDKEAIREFLADPNAELTFVNYITITAEHKTYRVYRNEKNGHCYDIDDKRNVSTDKSTLKGCCGWWKSPEELAEMQRIREKVKETCFGTGVAKKLYDPNMQCYVPLENKKVDGKQAIIDWRKGKKEEWEDKITLPDTEKENILIQEYTATDGSVWTLAATPPDPNLIQAIKEGLKELIREGKYNQK